MMQLKRYVVPAILLVSLAIPINGLCEDMSILILDCKAKRPRKPRQCNMLINRGYRDGLLNGLTGFVWTLNKNGDTVRTAEFKVTDVTPDKAMCDATTLSNKKLTKFHKVSLDVPVLDATTLNSVAQESFANGNFERAEYYYSNLLSLSPNDASVSAHVAQCQQRLKEDKNRALTVDEMKREKFIIPSYEKLIDSYLRLRDFPAAKRYADKILMANETHRLAEHILDILPDLEKAYNEYSEADDLVEIPPVLLRGVNPKYPSRAKRTGAVGTVSIKAFVERTGKISSAHVSKTSGTRELDESALRVAYSNLFYPGIQNGKPVPVWVTYEVEFKFAD